MRRSEAGISQVLAEARVEPEEINFAFLQSAATATELVAQLCVRVDTPSRVDQSHAACCRGDTSTPLGGITVRARQARIFRWIKG